MSGCRHRRHARGHVVTLASAEPRSAGAVAAEPGFVSLDCQMLAFGADPDVIIDAFQLFLAALALFEVLVIPMLGQNVHIAQMPGPTGFGCGSP